MKLVVDYVGFEKGGDPIVKELAAVSFDGQRSAQLLLRPPVPWSALDSQTKASYHTQIKEKHGLCWDEGVLPYLELGDQLKKITSRAIALYALGEEKCKFLSKLCGRTFIDIEKEFGALDPDCTAISGVSCLQPCHGLSTMACALRNADRLRQWLQYYDHRTRIVNFCYTGKPTTASVDDGCMCVKPI